MCTIIKRVFNCLPIHYKEELTKDLLSYRQYHLVAKLYFQDPKSPHKLLQVYNTSKKCRFYLPNFLIYLVFSYRAFLVAPSRF